MAANTTEGIGESVDTLANLEERINRAVQIISQLRAENDNLQAKVNKANRSGGVTLYNYAQAGPPRPTSSRTAPPTRRHCASRTRACTAVWSSPGPTTCWRS